MILSNIETPHISTTEPTVTKPAFKMEETKSHKTNTMDYASKPVTSFADIKVLNENDAEIKRLQKENNFLNFSFGVTVPQKKF